MSKQAKVLNKKEIAKLMKAVALTKHPLRNKTMVYMSFFAGARACEIANIRVCDVLGADGSIREVVTLSASQTKGQQRHRLFINKQLQKQLADYIAAKPNLMLNTKQALFQSQKRSGFSAQTVINLFAKLYDDACISGASSHSGRRTFITNLADKGINPRVIQSLARHSSLNTTMRYIDVNDTKLRSAVELAII